MGSLKLPSAGDSDQILPILKSHLMNTERTMLYVAAGGGNASVMHFGDHFRISPGATENLREQESILIDPCFPLPQRIKVNKEDKPLWADFQGLWSAGENWEMVDLCGYVHPPKVKFIISPMMIRLFQLPVPFPLMSLLWIIAPVWNGAPYLYWDYLRPETSLPIRIPPRSEFYTPSTGVPDWVEFAVAALDDISNDNRVDPDDPARVVISS